MGKNDLQPRPSEAQGVGVGGEDWTPQELRLRTRIIEHCQSVATFDRDYAKWAYRSYREQLPWLKL
jgi:hypothetical protein